MGSLISPDELASAEVSLEFGIESHTIGYELEITEPAYKELPFPRHRLGDNSVPHPEDDLEIQRRAALTGYDTGNDEAYELASPPTTHPYALYIAQLGVVRAGLVPETPKHMVTEHISIGFNTEPYQFDEYLQILRTTELLGASSSYRIMEPCTIAAQMKEPLPPHNYSFAPKGLAGLRAELWHGIYEEKPWVGPNPHRYEFRSLHYRQANQLLLGLDAIYYLTRGMHGESGSSERHSYENFLAIYHTETKRLKLPGPVHNRGLKWGDSETFTNYFQPFAELAEDPRSSKHLRDAARTAILGIREELGMDAVWSPFESVHYRRHARLGRANLIPLHE